MRPPRIAIPLRPEQFGLRVEDVRLTAADGVRLAGWFLARPGAPAVVLLHGYPAEKADLLPVAAALHRRLAVLLMDLRYFGASGGRVTTLGHRERHDLRHALDFLESRGHRAVGVFGFSLGGAVALLAAAEDRRIAALVAYSPFADLRQLGGELYAHFWLLRGPLVHSMRLWGRLLLGADITRPAPVTAAARLAVPVWVLHSRHDEQIPLGHAERLAEALAGNRQARVDIVDDGGRHGHLGADFDSQLADFFLRHLR